MPKGTPVHKLFDALVKKAAKIAQAKTGTALATGKPPKKGKKK